MIAKNLYILLTCFISFCFFVQFGIAADDLKENYIAPENVGQGVL